MELKNIFGTAALQEHFQQYEYIFHPDYYQHTTTYPCGDGYVVHVEEYNHTYSLSKNMKKSVSCQRASVYACADNALIYEYKNYFGKLCVAFFMWEKDSPFLFLSCDLNGYVFYNLRARQEYGYYPRGYADGTLVGVPYWYVTGVLFNPENQWIAINGQDLMNCPYACLLDLSDLSCMPYPMVSLSQLVSKNPSLMKAGIEDFSTAVLGWNADNSVNIWIDEEKSFEINIGENFYKQSGLFFEHKKRISGSLKGAR